LRKERRRGREEQQVPGKEKRGSEGQEKKRKVTW